MHSYWLPFLDGFAQHHDNTVMADVADGITQHGDDSKTANEGDSILICFPDSNCLRSMFVCKD
jgi:hypothetical protein